VQRRTRVLISLMAVGGILVAGCGSDDDDQAADTTVAEAPAPSPTSAETEPSSGTEPATSDTEPTSSSVEEPTGEPIVLYSSFPMSGGVDLTSLRRGGEVAADAINARGGVQGRPIQFVACDMKMTPAGSEECGRAAIEDNAVALLMSQDAFGGAIALTSAEGIPSYGNCVCTAEDAVNELSFPTVTGPVSQAAQGLIAGLLGAKTVSAALFDGAAGDTIGANVEAGLTVLGQSLDIPVKIPQNAGDLSPYVAQLMEAEAVVLITSPAITINLIRSLAQAGYEGVVVSSSSLVTPADLERLGDDAEGIYIVGGSLPSTAAGAPGVDEFNAEFDEFGDDTTARGGYAVEAWSIVNLVAEVMQGMDTIDSASFIEAMAAAGELEAPPSVPVNFAEPVAEFLPVRDFTSYFYVVQVVDGVLTPLQDEPFDYSNPPASLN
jgi:ABC-type branched-subunit amino acid transport system substrate-binding protein